MRGASAPVLVLEREGFLFIAPVIFVGRHFSLLAKGIFLLVGPKKQQPAVMPTAVV